MVYDQHAYTQLPNINIQVHTNIDIPTFDHVTEFTDQQLLDNFHTTRDARFSGLLFDRYAHLVYGVCLKYLKSRDESQDAMMSIYESINKSLISSKVTYFRSWLYQVTKNHCFAQLRKKNMKGSIISISNMENEPLIYPNDDGDELEGDLKRLAECIEKLKNPQKICVTGFYLKKKSYKEISGCEGIEVGAVKSAIQNGRRNLKQCLEKTSW